MSVLTFLCLASLLFLSSADPVPPSSNSASSVQISTPTSNTVDPKSSTNPVTSPSNPAGPGQVVSSTCTLVDAKPVSDPTPPVPPTSIPVSQQPDNQTSICSADGNVTIAAVIDKIETILKTCLPAALTGLEPEEQDSVVDVTVDGVNEFLNYLYLVSDTTQDGDSAAPKSDDSQPSSFVAAQIDDLIGYLSIPYDYFNAGFEDELGYA